MALFQQFDVDEFSDIPSLIGRFAPEQPKRTGIMAALSDPRVLAMLSGASRQLLAAGAPSLTPKGTGVGAALGAGFGGAIEGAQSYEEQLAKQAAESLRQKMEERKLALEEQKLTREKSASFGKWAGVGFNPETQRYEIIQLSDTGEKVWSGVEADPKMQYLDTGSGYQPVNTRTLQAAGPVIPKELPPEKTPENVAAAAQAGEVGKARGEAKGEQETIETKAPKAQEILEGLESSLRELPESPAGMKWENMKAFWGVGDEKVQDAAGRAAFYSGRMIEFVNKLPGAATDREFPVFMASAGIATDENMPAARRIAAAREAKKYFAGISARSSKQPTKQQPTQNTNKNLRSKYGL